MPCARIAAPALLFKSEAIVHPDEVARYIHPDECQISYNPLLMALLWESLATREVKLLATSMRARVLRIPTVVPGSIMCAAMMILAGHFRMKMRPGWGSMVTTTAASSTIFIPGAFPGQLCPRPAVSGKSQNRRLPDFRHLRLAGRTGKGTA